MRENSLLGMWFFVVVLVFFSHLVYGLNFEVSSNATSTSYNGSKIWVVKDYEAFEMNVTFTGSTNYNFTSSFYGLNLVSFVCPSNCSCYSNETYLEAKCFNEEELSMVIAPNVSGFANIVLAWRDGNEYHNETRKVYNDEQQPRVDEKIVSFPNGTVMNLESDVINLYERYGDELTFNFTISDDFNTSLVSCNFTVIDNGPNGGVVDKSNDCYLKANESWLRPGSYNVSFLAKDFVGHEKRENLEIQIYPVPNFKVSSIDVEPTYFKDGSNVTLVVNVSNEGDEGYYCGDCRVDVLIYEENDTLIKKFENVTLNTSSYKLFNVSLEKFNGSHTFLAEVNYTGKESRKDDNLLKKTLSSGLIFDIAKVVYLNQTNVSEFLDNETVELWINVTLPNTGETPSLNESNFSLLDLCFNETIPVDFQLSRNDSFYVISFVTPYKSGNHSLKVRLNYTGDVYENFLNYTISYPVLVLSSDDIEDDQVASGDSVVFSFYVENVGSKVAKNVEVESISLVKGNGRVTCGQRSLTELSPGEKERICTVAIFPKTSGWFKVRLKVKYDAEEGVERFVEGESNTAWFDVYYRPAVVVQQTEQGTSQVSESEGFIKVVMYPEYVEVEKGSSKVFSVTVKNNFNENKEVKVWLENLPKNWYSVEPSKATIQPNSSKSFLINITPSESAKEGRDYFLLVASTNGSEHKVSVDIVVIASKDELKMLNSTLLELKNELEVIGEKLERFGIKDSDYSRAMMLLVEAEDLLSRKDLASTKQKVREIEELINKLKSSEFSEKKPSSTGKFVLPVQPHYIGLVFMASLSGVFLVKKEWVYFFVPRYVGLFFKKKKLVKALRSMSGDL